MSQNNITNILQLLDESDAIAAKATAGPWTAKLNHAPYKIVWIDKRESYSTLELKADDADFISHARTHVPRLNAIAREALRRLAVADEALSECGCWCELMSFDCGRGRKKACQRCAALATLRAPLP